jgi:hypothetical protein
MASRLEAIETRLVTARAAIAAGSAWSRGDGEKKSVDPPQTTKSAVES